MTFNLVFLRFSIIAYLNSIVYHLKTGLLDANEKAKVLLVYSQLSNIIGQLCESSGYLCSVIGQDRVADILRTQTAKQSITHRGKKVSKCVRPGQLWPFKTLLQC